MKPTFFFHYSHSVTYHINVKMSIKLVMVIEFFNISLFSPLKIPCNMEYSLTLNLLINAPDQIDNNNLTA